MAKLADDNGMQRLKVFGKATPQRTPTVLSEILYEHCEDLTDVQHIKLMQAIQAYCDTKVLEGRIDELLEIGLIAHKHEGESPVVWQIADEIDRRRESLTKTREGK